MNYFWQALQNTFNYRDRARRREYGWFILISWLISVTLEILSAGAISLYLDSLVGLLALAQMGWGVVVYPLANLSVTTRRLHDLGVSGWWQLAPILGLLIAIILVVITYGTSSIGEVSLSAIITTLIAAITIVSCLIFQLCLIFKDGQPFSNRFGASPKFGEFANALQDEQKMS